MTPFKFIHTNISRLLSNPESYIKSSTILQNLQQSHEAKEGDLVVIAADNDGKNEATAKALATAEETLRKKGAEVLVIAPQEQGDFNDVLCQTVQDAVEEPFMREISPHIDSSWLEVWGSSGKGLLTDQEMLDTSPESIHERLDARREDVAQKHDALKEDFLKNNKDTISLMQSLNPDYDFGSFLEELKEQRPSDVKTHLQAAYKELFVETAQNGFKDFAQKRTEVLTKDHVFTLLRAETKFAAETFNTHSNVIFELDKNESINQKLFLQEEEQEKLIDRLEAKVVVLEKTGRQDVVESFIEDVRNGCEPASREWRLDLYAQNASPEIIEEIERETQTDLSCLLGQDETSKKEAAKAPEPDIEKDRGFGMDM